LGYIKKDGENMLYRVRVGQKNTQFTDDLEIACMWAKNLFLDDPKTHVYIQSKETPDDFFVDEYEVIKNGEYIEFIPV
jgi:hypothetical protein